MGNMDCLDICSSCMLASKQWNFSMTFTQVCACVYVCACVRVRILCRSIIIINLIYIAQFDTNGILTALYIVITYIQMQYVHVCTDAEQSYKYTYTCLHIHTYTVTCTNIHLPTS